jgi:hypothetical protein
MTSPPDNSTGSPGPGRVLLALARDLTGRAQAARAAAEPVTGPELGAWLRAQRDTSLPGTSSLAHNIYRWERGKHHLTDRYRLYYCRALGITPRDFGPAGHPLPELDALRLGWGDAYDITMSVGTTIMKRLAGGR